MKKKYLSGPVSYRVFRETGPWVGANSKLFFFKMKSKPPQYGFVSRLFILLCKDSESCEELMSDKRNTDSFL